MNKPRCADCIYSHEVRDPKNPLVKVRICKHSPPSVVLMAMQIGGQTVAVPHAMWPPIPDEEWCGQFDDGLGALAGQAANN